MALQQAPATGASGSSVADPAVIDWLLAGDPAIGWQTRRDLLDAPPAIWGPFRRAR
jgi:hypothetical protein